MTRIRWWPWPSRAERRASVAAALRNAEKARRAAHRAEILAADLRAMEKDQLAFAIIEGLQISPEVFPGRDDDRKGRGT